jgi:cyanate lyase
MRTAQSEKRYEGRGLHDRVNMVLSGKFLPYKTY